MVVCGNECGIPDWTYVGMIVNMSGVAWIFVYLCGVYKWRESISKDMESVKQDIQVRIGRITPVIAHLMLGFSAMQCTLFMWRSVFKSANMMFWIAELIGCVIYIIDSWHYFSVAFLSGLGEGTRYMVTRGAFDCVLPMSHMSMMIFTTADGSKTFMSFGFMSAVYFRLAFRELLDVWRLDPIALRTQVMWSTVSIFSIVYAAAMSMMVMENLGDPDLLAGLNDGRWNVLSALYFVVSTITTVGYGDLTPETSLGRICTIVGVFGGLGALGMTFQQISKVIALNSQGGGAFLPPARCHHIVVAGNPTATTAIDFILEVFHDDHADDAEDLKLVFYVPKANASDFITRVGSFLKKKSNIKIAPRVTLLMGNAVDATDMHRAGVAQAAALFVFPSSTADPTQEDTENIIRMMSIRRVVKHLRIILILLKAEHLSLLRETGVRSGHLLTVLACDQFKFELVGKTCQVPGLSTLICNLCKTTGDAPEEVAATWPLWKQEYIAGSGNELYEVELSPAYCAKRAFFSDVVKDVLDQSQNRRPVADGPVEPRTVYLIGLVETRPNGEKRILLNPGPRFPIKHPSTSILVSGIFITDARDSITQCEADKPFEVSKDGIRGKTKKDADPDSAFMEGQGKGDEAEEGVAGTANYLQIDESLLGGDGITTKQMETAKELVRLASFQRRGNAPARPPLKMLAKGGHVVVLCVGINQSQEAKFRLGVEHFVAPLRAAHAATMPTIVVMAPCPPKDWYNTINYKRVYFLRGSPLSVFDLERVNVKHASTIFICHAGSGGESTMTENWMADSEVICATRLVEAQLGKESNCQVITELNCDTNHQFIQLPQLADGDDPEERKTSKERPMAADQNPAFDKKRSMASSMSQPFYEPDEPDSPDSPAFGKKSSMDSMETDLTSPAERGSYRHRASDGDDDNPLALQVDDWNRQTSTGSSKKMAEKCSCGMVFVDESAFCHKCGKKRPEVGKMKNKMKELVAKPAEYVSDDQEYYKQPRYACAQLFVGSVVTSLAANTFFNPTLTELVSMMAQAKVSVQSVGREWSGKSYYEYHGHLLWFDKLYAIGIYRQGEANAMTAPKNTIMEDPDMQDDEESVEEKKTINYVFTAPDGSTELRENDRILCFGQSAAADKELREEAKAARLLQLEKQTERNEKALKDFDNAKSPQEVSPDSSPGRGGGAGSPGGSSP